MNDYYNLYINKTINSIINHTDDSNYNCIFIKHYRTFDIDFSELQQIIHTTMTPKFLSYTFSASTMMEAYEPFLGWIRTEYLALQTPPAIEDFLNNCNVYSLHHSIFKSYIESGHCQREEDVIIPEISYEKSQIIKDILSIFSYLSSNKPLVIMLNRLHFAPLSTLELLKEFINLEKKPPIAVIATYNELYQLESYMQKVWKSLTFSVETQQIQLDWSSQDRSNDNINTQDETVSQFIPVASCYHTYVLKLNNMFHTLALEQAAHYAEIIYHKLEVEKTDIPLEIKIKILLIASITYIYLGNTIKSSLICEKIRSNIHTLNNNNFYFYYYYTHILAQTYSGQFDIAAQNASTCLKFAENLRDDYLVFKAKLLQYIIHFHGWKDIYFCDFSFHIDEQFYCDLKKYNFYNHLSHLCTYQHEYGEVYVKNAVVDITELSSFQEGIKWAKKIGNENFILQAYKDNIMIASCFGHFESVEFLYMKCLDILKGMNNPLEESNIYNGLGYNSIIKENYDKANHYFNKSLEILSKYNYPEEAYETLYNKSFNAITAGDYKCGCNYLLSTLQIVHELDIVKLRICNKSKIYGLLALCYYYLGLDYNCYLYLNKMQRYISHILDSNNPNDFNMWDDDLFLYWFVLGMLKRSEGELENAKTLFDKAAFHMNRSRGSKFFTYPKLALEQAQLFRMLKQEKEAEKILTECMQFCKQEGYQLKYQLLSATLTRSEFRMPGSNLSPMDGVSLESIIENAKNLGTQKKLLQRTNDINFLTTWQDITSTDVSKGMLLDNALTTIQSNFTLDHIIFLTKTDCAYEITYSNLDFVLSNDNIQKIIKFASNQTTGFVTNRTEKSFEDNKKIISVFGLNQIASFVCCPVVVKDEILSVFIGYINIHENFVENTVRLNINDLNIVRFTIRQLMDILEKLDARNHLKVMNKILAQNAITDILTGLLNRQGFLNKFKDSNKNLESYSILYIDLDSFKYYNDTFGHDIGDEILVAFSNLFRKVVNEKGYCVRYGGDEFIIVLENASENDAIVIAQKIFSNLKTENHFAHIVEQKTSSSPVIPDDNKVSCSIGIAQNKDEKSELTYNLSETLKHADDALYYVKKHCKRNFKTWSSL